jgi:hypothetical protein
LKLGFGSTFWASSVAFVPRSLWENKPPGFGAVLVPYLSPLSVGTSHSDAALFQGEWLFDFGFLGLVAMVLVVGWYIAKLDIWLTELNSRPVSTRRRLLAVVSATILASGLGNLLWVGSFTYFVRAVGPLLAVGVLFAVAGRKRVGFDDLPEVAPGASDPVLRRNGDMMLPQPGQA